MLKDLEYVNDEMVRQVMADVSSSLRVKNLLPALVRVVDKVCNKVGIGLQKQPDLVVSSSEEARLLNLTEIDLAELEILLEDTKVLTA